MVLRTSVLEKYHPGGFHPVSIGDMFAGSRYKVLHKLGSGDSSMVWLAWNQCPGDQLPEHLGNPVTLKVMSAEQSSKLRTKIADYTFLGNSTSSPVPWIIWVEESPGYWGPFLTGRSERVPSLSDISVCWTKRPPCQNVQGEFPVAGDFEGIWRERWRYKLLTRWNSYILQELLMEI